MGVASSFREGKEGVSNMSRVLVWEDGKVLEIDDGDGCTIMCINIFNATELYTLKWIKW